MHYADSRETVLRQESSKKFVRESITRSRPLDVRRSLKRLESVSSIKSCEAIGLVYSVEIAPIHFELGLFPSMKEYNGGERTDFRHPLGT